MLQPFENDDLFDAEIGEDSDDREDGNLSNDDYDAPKSPSHGQSHSGATMSSDDESTCKNVKKREKREAKRKVKS